MANVAFLSNRLRFNFIYSFYTQSVLKVNIVRQTSLICKNNLYEERRGYSGWDFTKNPFNRRKMDKYIPLMLFREIIWPNIFNNLKTITFTNVLIRQFIDPMFKKKEFLDEAKLMTLKVSRLLSQGDIDGLRGLVTDDAIRELRPNLIKMSRNQRQALAMDPDRVILGFIYSLDVRVDKSTVPQKRFVEITCCFHSYNDQEMKAETKKFDIPLRKIFQNRDKHMICNYRFVREYTKGVNGRWIVNRLNHFTPGDIPRLFKRVKLTN